MSKTAVKVAVVPFSLVLPETAPKVIPAEAPPIVNAVVGTGKIFSPLLLSCCQFEESYISDK